MTANPEYEYAHAQPCPGCGNICVTTAFDHCTKCGYREPVEGQIDEGEESTPPTRPKPPRKART